MSKLILEKRPKNPKIIGGFPGFGMVGTIATEFLIEHLAVEPIGRVVLEDVPAMTAVHEGHLIEPFGIFYSKKYNLIIVHAIGGGPGTEWKISDMLLEIARITQAKEIICLEGIGSGDEEIGHPRTFYYSKSPQTGKKLDKLKVIKLEEGIIMGVTSALLLKIRTTPLTCLFAETHSKLPDSEAAANIIKVLDSYLGLKVDFKPLLEMAVQFETKLKKILQQSRAAEEQRDEKLLSYVG